MNGNNGHASHEELEPLISLEEAQLAQSLSALAEQQHPSATFAAELAARLNRHIQAHPKRRPLRTSFRSHLGQAEISPGSDEVETVAGQPRPSDSVAFSWNVPNHELKLAEEVVSGPVPKGRQATQRSQLFVAVALTAVFVFLLTGVVIALQGQALVSPGVHPEPTATPLLQTTQASVANGETLFAAGQLQPAIAIFEQVTAQDAQNVDAWVALARTQIYARQYVASLDSATQVLALAPDSVKARAIYAWALYWNIAPTGCGCKTQAEAQQAAQAALSADGNDALAHAYYSEILNAAGDFADGLREAQQALALAPQALDARRALGVARETAGDYAGAVEAYQSALVLNPNLAPLYLRLGRAYRAQAQKEGMSFQLAIRAFTKAQSINPNDIDPYLDLSLVYYENDQLDLAEPYLEQALQLQPENPDIHGRLGLLLARRNDHARAQAELALAVFGGDYAVQKDFIVTVKGLDLGLTSKEFYAVYGSLLASGRKCDEAQAIFHRLQQAFPNDPVVQKAYTESQTGCPESAPTSTSAEALTRLPLARGVTWVYAYVAYEPLAANPTQTVTATYRLTETVADTETASPYFVAHVQRTQSLVEAEPGWPNEVSSQPDEYWYLVRGHQVYQSFERLNWTDLPTATLTLAYDLPLAVGRSWCPNSLVKGEPVQNCITAGQRTVISHGSYVTPAGSFDDCYQIAEAINSGGVTRWFCTGIGIVAQVYDHAGTRFGFTQVLQAYVRGEP